MLRSLRTPFACLILACGLAAPAAAQTGTLDQQSPFHNVGYNGALSSLVWQQTIWVGVPGFLEGFEIELNSTMPNDTIEISVMAGEAWNVSTPVWSGLVTNGVYTNTYHRVFVDVSSANLNLGVGDAFTIQLKGTGGMMGFRGQTSQPYVGDFYLNGVIDNTDLGFNTYMLSSPGPTLSVSNLVAGQVAVLAVDYATPNNAVLAGYSRFGGGPTPTAFGDLLLTPPYVQLPPIATDALGHGSISGPIPPALGGTSIWFHALDVATSTLTNGLAEIVG